MRLLILGGTASARSLADAAVAGGHEVTSSLAGRTIDPRRPGGAVRTGGFGGESGLRAFLLDTRPDAVIDATHPFAATMSAHAAAACQAAGIPLLRLDRPSWRDHPLAATWRWVDTHEEAASWADRLGGRVLLTVGRQSLPRYAGLAAEQVVARIAQDDGSCPRRFVLLVDRGPFTLAGELELFERHGIEVLVSKDSGGSETAAKLEAAHRLGVAVVMVARPAPPSPAPPRVVTLPQALGWLAALPA